MLVAISRRPVLLAALMVVASASLAVAQQPATPAPGSAAFAPDSGAVAPDFTIPGATRFGLLKDPVRLSDYRGQTVVLAFFPKARTKG
jgi:peroxiredoxin Q/BCP